MEYVILNNGVKMPMVGLGSHMIPNDQMSKVIAMAYEVGYRKIDSAWLYGNEEFIGKALKENDIPREEMFITSKLNINNLYWRGYHQTLPNIRIRSVKKAFEESCKRLGTDYLDLYLLHWPSPGYEKQWEDVVKLYEAGRVKAIGVSSFLPKHLERLASISSIVPVVNQFELNPINSQVDETLYNQSKGIQVEAYASFGTTKKNENASLEILGHETILTIAEAHKKTPSQIVLRWTVQRGVTVIPRSKSREHLAENLDIFDFELTEEEMKAIYAMNRNRYSRGNPHIE